MPPDGCVPERWAERCRRFVQHELFMTTDAVSPETIVQIVDDVLLPLATTFGRVVDEG